MTVTINGVSPTTAQQREFATAMGLPILLQTVTVATAQQDIDFTGLDLDADVQYRIELLHVPNASEIQSVKIFFNADTTEGNYRRQRVSGIALAASASSASDAFIIIGNGATADTNYTLQASISVSQVTGKYPVALGVFSNQAGTAFTNTGVSSVARVDTANVTSIKLRHTSNFGVGTVAKIYKI